MANSQSLRISDARESAFPNDIREKIFDLYFTTKSGEAESGWP